VAHIRVNSISNIEALFVPEKNEISVFKKTKKGVKSFDLEFKHLPKLKSFGVDGEAENPIFEKHINEKKQKERQEKYFGQPDGNPPSDQEEFTADAADFKEPDDKE